MAQRTVLTLILLATAVVVAQAADKPIVSGEAGRKADEYLTRLEKLGFSGGALLVRGTDTLLMKSYGEADREKRLPLATDSVYSLGSITKQFTAAAILTLEMQGRLSVNDPVGKYFDGVPADKTGITLHHLLTHSSGLESDFSPTDYAPVGREEYVRRALQSRLLFKPGDGYEYSNAGYSLLAAVVERVSGQTYEDYLTERVLKPAGMRETGYKRPAWDTARVAHGFQEGKDWGTILQRIQPADAPYWALRGNGGLHTTLGDMLAWHRALSTDAVLSKAARTKYFTPYVAEGPAGRSFYAYGWAVSRSLRGTTVVQHNGGNGVYVAEFLRFPDEDAMLFLVSTNAGMKATPVVRSLELLLFGGTVALPPAAVPLPPDLLASYAGRWGLPRGGTIATSVDGNALGVTTDSAEGLAALYPAPRGQADRLAQLSARTAEFSARAFKGDVSGLLEAMGGAAAIENLRQQELDLMADREQRLGRFVASSVLGTIPRSGDTVQTVVALRFERATVFNVYIWGPRRVLGILAMPQLPALRFVPTSDRTFVSYSLDPGGATLTMVFQTAGADRVMVLPGPAGPVTARLLK